MKPKIKKYRRISDGLVVEAIQYDLPHRKFNQDAISTIARFVLNMDVDSRVTVANERILDVVRPVPDRWDPLAGVATIAVIDPATNQSLWVELFDWIARDNGKIIAINSATFLKEFTEILPPKARTELEELTEVIYNTFSSLEGDVYQELAKKAAREVIREGWSKESRSSKSSIR